MAIFGLSLVSNVRAETKQPSDGDKLLSVHVNGETQGILTQATTIGDALDQAEISVNDKDLIEPNLDEELVASHYDVNIYRARPITIVDGPVRMKVTTPYQTPEQIAKDAKLELQDEDIATMHADVDLRAAPAGLYMTIDRATPLTLIMYGKKVQSYTQAATVGEMLEQNEISLGDKDTLSVDEDTKVTAGMTVELWRNGKQTITKNESIPFPVEQVKDADRPVGYKKVTTQGVKGKKTVSYEVFMKNGKEVKRKKIQSVTTKQPKKQVEVVGAKRPTLPGGSHQDWMKSAGMSPGDYGYINYIFENESGWNPAAENPGLYYGLGQTNLGAISSACPNWESDPVCQVKFFNGYAKSRYGSWSAAKDFKARTGWW